MSPSSFSCNWIVHMNYNKVYSQTFSDIMLFSNSKCSHKLSLILNTLLLIFPTNPLILFYAPLPLYPPPPCHASLPHTLVIPKPTHSMLWGPYANHIHYEDPMLTTSIHCRLSANSLSHPCTSTPISSLSDTTWYLAHREHWDPSPSTHIIASTHTHHIIFHWEDYIVLESLLK